jgi:hypothetical protein
MAAVERLVLDQLRQVRVATQDGDDAIEDRSTVALLARRLRELGQQLEHRPDAAREDGGVERILAREVVVERRDPQLDGRGDVAQRGARVATLGEERLCRVEDALGGQLALAAKPRVEARGGLDRRQGSVSEKTNDR